MPSSEITYSMSIRNELHRPKRPTSHARRWPHVDRRRGHDDLVPLIEMNTSEIDSLLSDLGEQAEDPNIHFDEADTPAHEDRSDEPNIRVRTRFNREAAGPITDMWMVRSGKAPLLTAAQELVLAKRLEHGDSLAKEELV